MMLHGFSARSEGKHEHRFRAADSAERETEFSHSHSLELRESIREDVAFIVRKETQQIVQLIRQEIHELGKTLSEIVQQERPWPGYWQERQANTEIRIDYDTASEHFPCTGDIPLSSEAPISMCETLLQKNRSMCKTLRQKKVSDEFPDEVLEDATVQLLLHDELTQGDSSGEMATYVAGGQSVYTPIADSDMELAFRAAYLGNVAQVQTFLDRQADPNAKFSSFQGNNQIFTDCNLLPIAAMADSIALVRLLLERQANVDGSYGFSAGALRMQWSGKATFSAVSKGHLEVLKELVSFKGDLHALSSNGANLIWQASYFGHMRILDYLINHEVSCEIRAQSQDIAGVSYCPLHIATLQGHTRVVRSLLAAKVEAQCKNEQRHSPLIDAIVCGRPELVRILISHGALLTEYGAGDHLQASDCSGCHVLEYLFRVRNPVLVHAAALGLQAQEQQMNHISTEHVLQFMKQGDTNAVKAIFKAIFRKRDVVCRGDHHEKTSLRTAMMPRNVPSGGYAKGHIYVSQSGYTFFDISELFRKRQVPDQPLKDFFENLLPQKKNWSDIRRHHLTTVDVYESLVPDFHNDMRVVHAIKRLSSFDPVLESRQCRAIIAINWHAHRLAVTVHMVNHALLLLVFFGVALLLLETCAGEVDCQHSERKHSKIQILALCGIPFVVCEGLMELAELVVVARCNWLGEYIRKFSRDVELVRIFADGWVLASVGLWVNQDGYNTRVVFAICCYAKWLRFLHVLSPVRVVGIHVIPIVYAVRTILPFIGVMVFYLVGTWHAYIALRFGVFHAFDGFTEIMTFTLDISAIPKLLQSPYPSISTGEIQRRITNLLVIVMSFLLPVALMNAFIAALVNSYTEGIVNIERLYQHRRAQTVFSMMACRTCFDLLRRTCCWRDQDDTGQSSRKILWYCHEKSKDLQD